MELLITTLGLRARPRSIIPRAGFAPWYAGRTALVEIVEIYTYRATDEDAGSDTRDDGITHFVSMMMLQ
jgi:hypothetical protein